MKELTAKDIMTTDVVWLSESTSVEEACRLFMEESISGAPVVNDEGIMTGVVSLRDFVKNGKVTERLKATETVFYNENWALPLSSEEISGFQVECGSELLIKEIMTPVVFNASIDTPVTELAETMLRGRIHRMVILDGNDLAGVVTTMDMLKVITGTGIND